MDLKERIRKGWDLSAEGYSTKIVPNDFVDPGKEIWTDLILEKAPREGRLKILDIGTGPGVFATILSLAGHDVVGIDISTEMLKHAKKNAEKYGASPEFLLMDSQEPDFPDDTFDLIVSRNVVWIMQDPVKAYKNWLRILKKGGRMLVFDGGHNKENFLTKFDHNIESYIEEYKEKFGEEPPVSFPREKYEEARGWKRELPLTYENRPEWDVETLKALGYEQVEWEDVADRAAYTDETKFEYRGKVFFRLCGSKAAG